MTKHYPRSNNRQQQKQQQHREKGWYCKEHDTKYLFDICGYDSMTAYIIINKGK
ncbi:MAG: hypothetical protein ACRD5J_16825 [Nitrososphaeraceae archaeon]